MADKPCPNCGHCPSCGRSNFNPWVNPYAYPYTWIYTQPNTVKGPLTTWGTGTANA